MPCRQISKDLIVVILAGIGCSGLLQLAGIVTPGWERSSRQHRDKGIWYTVTCEANDCETEFIDDVSSITHIHVQTTSALAICLFVIIYLMYYTRTGRPMLKPVALSAYLSLLSGILSFTPAALHIDWYMRLRRYTGEFPYSVFLTGLGGAIALVISVISMWQTYSKLGTNEQRPELPPVQNQQDEITLL